MKKETKQGIRSVGLLVFLGVGVYFLIPQLTSIEKSVYVLKSLKYWSLALVLFVNL